MPSIEAMTVDAMDRPSDGHAATMRVRISGGGANLYGRLSRRIQKSQANPMSRRIRISPADLMSRRIRISQVALMIHRSEVNAAPMGCSRTTRMVLGNPVSSSTRTGSQDQMG